MRRHEIQELDLNLLQQSEPDSPPTSPHRPRALVPLVLGVGAFIGSMIGQSADEAPPHEHTPALQAKRPTVSSPKPALSRTEQVYGVESERWKKTVGNQRIYKR